MAASLIRSRAMVTHAMDRHRWNEIADGAVLQQDGAIAIGTGGHRCFLLQSAHGAHVVRPDRHVPVPRSPYLLAPDGH